MWHVTIRDGSRKSCQGKVKEFMKPYLFWKIALVDHQYLDQAFFSSYCRHLPLLFKSKELICAARSGIRTVLTAVTSLMVLVHACLLLEVVEFVLCRKWTFCLIFITLHLHVLFVAVHLAFLPEPAYRGPEHVTYFRGPNLEVTAIMFGSSCKVL